MPSDEQLIARLIQAAPKADYPTASMFVRLYREMQRIEREERPAWHDPAA